MISFFFVCITDVNIFINHSVAIFKRKLYFYYLILDYFSLLNKFSCKTVGTRTYKIISLSFFSSNRVSSKQIFSSNSNYSVCTTGVHSQCSNSYYNSFEEILFVKLYCRYFLFLPPFRSILEQYFLV